MALFTDITKKIQDRFIDSFTNYVFLGLIAAGSGAAIFLARFNSLQIALGVSLIINFVFLIYLAIQAIRPKQNFRISKIFQSVKDKGSIEFQIPYDDYSNYELEHYVVVTTFEHQPYTKITGVKLEMGGTETAGKWRLSSASSDSSPVTAQPNFAPNESYELLLTFTLFDLPKDGMAGRICLIDQTDKEHWLENVKFIEVL